MMVGVPTLPPTVRALGCYSRPRLVCNIQMDPKMIFKYTNVNYFGDPIIRSLLLMRHVELYLSATVLLVLACDVTLSIYLELRH